MSTRSGEFVTLRELRKEVGNDAARFFYIMRKNDQHLDFDLELAKAQSTIILFTIFNMLMPEFVVSCGN